VVHHGRSELTAFAFTELWRALRTALLVLVIIVWGVAVIIIGVKGGDVDRPNRVPQLYGIWCAWSRSLRF
jgi:hypothetical protein